MKEPLYEMMKILQYQTNIEMHRNMELLSDPRISLFPSGTIYLDGNKISQEELHEYLNIKYKEKYG